MRLLLSLLAALTLSACNDVTVVDEPIPWSQHELDTEVEDFSIPAQAPVRMVQLTRPEWDVDSLTAHVVAAASTMAGVVVSETQARAWATEALAVDSESTYSDTPFSRYPDLSVRYDPYFASVHIRDYGIRNPTIDEMLNAQGELDDGIGAERARMRADEILGELCGAGAIPDADYALTGAGLSRRTYVPADAENSVVTVLDFVFIYNRVVDGIPVLNSEFQITVHRDGLLRDLRLTDVDIQPLDQVQTSISDDEAFEWMATRMLEELSSDVDFEVVLTDKEVGYHLPADQVRSTVGPVAKAQISLSRPDVEGRSQVGFISLLDEMPELVRPGS
ncbi:MAG: hypothetical protein AAF799_35745 [Myxococcota bacterium]